MSNYPSLSEMGIQRFSEIKTYTLRPDGKNRDILKVFYKREKNSLLPKRKTFRFGRSPKMLDGTETYEISPFLLKATDELDKIIGDKNTTVDKTKLLLQRIEELESELLAATHDLKSIVKSL